ncbi:hypothetical protein SGLAM104S_00411 [Streptomyces glaucescens]
MHGPVALGQRVDHRVDRPLPPGERTGQRPGQPQHGARIGQAGGEQHRALPGERLVHRVQPGGGGADVERAAQRVVDADHEGHQVRPQRQPGGQLGLQHVPGLCPADRQVGEPHGLRGESGGEQRGPTAPPVPHRIAHPFRERVAQRHEP